MDEWIDRYIHTSILSWSAVCCNDWLDSLDDIRLVLCGWGLADTVLVTDSLSLAILDDNDLRVWERRERDGENVSASGGRQE